MALRFRIALSVAVLAAASGCQSEHQSLTGIGPCYVDVPCETNTSMTCQVPCKQGSPSGGVGSGNGGTGGGSTGGAGGTAGTAGSGGAVDVTGTVVQLTSSTFDQSVPYIDPIHVIAPGADTKTVEADTVGGAFELTGAAKGPQWVLAQNAGGGTGGAFSTYSYQGLDGATDLALPVVPVTVLDDIATQINVVSFEADRAQIVLLITGANDMPLPGATLGPLAGASFGYDVGPGDWSMSPAETGTLGLAVAFNVLVAGSGSIDVPVTYNTKVEKHTVAVAPGTVTFGLIQIK